MIKNHKINLKKLYFKSNYYYDIKLLTRLEKKLQRCFYTLNKNTNTNKSTQ